jgi:urocanate hydratase
MSVARMHLPELSTIHDRFLSLSQTSRDPGRESLGATLVLRAQLDADGIAVLVAASVAGAASLCVDADADRLREGLRGGFVDFVVATLDEALRILKNEIRRARPISVGLTAAPEPCINAMIERGLQPDLLSAVPQPQAEIFQQRGAIVLPSQTMTDPATELLEWSIASNLTRAMQPLSELAEASLDPQRADTAARRRWLAQSPRYLGRSFASRQCLRMTVAEIADFLPHVHAEFPAAKITRDGEAV